MPFALKYKPKTLNEYHGQKEAVIMFRNWMDGWDAKKGRGLLLYGPPGSGKTALVEAWASEKNIDLIQLNASDYRSALDIKNYLGQSSKQQSLFRRGKIFLIDEIDGLSGQEDRGGASEIIELLKSSAHPIVLTANDPWDPKLRTLRGYCDLVEFKKLGVWDIQKKLEEIASKEEIVSDTETLRMISTRASGDMRAAMNDFETLSSGKKRISLENFEAIGFRERGENIFEVLRMIFKTQTAIGAKMAINQSDKDPDEIFWWIENNIMSEFEDPREIADAFDALSKADLFRQHVQSRQYWSLKSYMIDLMTAGVSMSKKNPYRKFTRYQYPRNIMILGRTKAIRKSRMETLKRMALDLHCSTTKVRNEYLPYLAVSMKSVRFRKRFIENTGLSKDEVKELFSK